MKATHHIILAPGKDMHCHCGDKASRFILCRVCSKIVASCGGHRLTIEEESKLHCKDKP